MKIVKSLEYNNELNRKHREKEMKKLLSVLFILLVIICLTQKTIATEQPKLVIIYSNGMFNKLVKVEISLIGLKSAFKQRFPDIKASFDYSWNRSEFILNQLIEVIEQREIDRFGSLFRWISGIEVAPDWFQNKMEDLAISIDSSGYIIDEDLRKHVAKYRAYLEAEHIVIVVSHSQGNFYANEAYAYLQNSDMDQKYLKNLAIVSVANPSTQVAGNPEATTLTTLTNDRIINSIRLVYDETLPGTFENYNQDNEGFWHHNFINSYLNGDRSGSKILEDIKNAYLKRTFFKVEATLNASTSFNGAWIADADNNGEDELIVFDGYDIKIYDSSLSHEDTITFAESPRSLDIADIDSDGKKEMIVGTGNGDSGGYVYVGEYNGTSWTQEGKSSLIQSIRYSEEVKAANLDTDPALEIAVGVSWYGRTLQVYDYSDGSFSLAWSDNIGSDVNYLDIGDIDGNGVAELAVGTECWGDFQGRIYGSGGSLLFNTGYSGRTHISLGDINGDGDDEFISSIGTSCGGGSSSTMGFKVYDYINSEFQTIYSSPQSSGYEATIYTLAYDMDGDGKDEIITTQKEQGGAIMKDLKIYRYDGETFNVIYSDDTVYSQESLRGIRGGVLNGARVLLLTSNKTIRIFEYNK